MTIEFKVEIRFSAPPCDERLCASYSRNQNGTPPMGRTIIASGAKQSRPAASGLLRRSRSLQWRSRPELAQLSLHGQIKPGHDRGSEIAGLFPAACSPLSLGW